VRLAAILRLLKLREFCLDAWYYCWNTQFFLRVCFFYTEVLGLLVGQSRDVLGTSSFVDDYDVVVK